MFLNEVGHYSGHFSACLRPGIHFARESREYATDFTVNYR